MSQSIRRVLLAVIAVLAAGCSNDNASGPIDNSAAAPVGLAEKAIQRSFSDFVVSQGTFCFPDGEGGCIDLEPPLKNFLGWSDPTSDFLALFEYLGNADAWLSEQSGGAISLGTEISGNLTEQPLEDGRALIEVNVHARNILSWLVAVDDFYLDPIVFGSRVGDVLDGAPPALGDLNMRVKFISPQQNAPIPDLFQLFLFPEPGQELVHVTVNMSAVGLLHEGSGYPEGTLARVRSTQVYPRVPTDGYDAGWPVERLEIRPVGGKKPGPVAAD